LKDLVNLAQKEPGKLTFASAGGVGQFPTHMAPEVLKYKQKLQINHVPYKGTGPAVVDVASGLVDMIMTTGLGSVRPFVDSGKMKVLAIAAPKRSEAAPNVPTFAEEGYPLPELKNGTIWGLLGPAGLPKDIVNRLHEVVVKAMASSEVREKLAQLNIYPRTSSPEELASIIKSESETWGSLLKRMNIQFD
jgi:tripartite-type tricarboxylate transporter receptor subunit TctC